MSGYVSSIDLRFYKVVNLKKTPHQRGFLVGTELKTVLVF